MHIRLANDDAPSKHVIEITNQESVFSPAKPYQTYIRVKGITFEYAGNSFPNPQRAWFPPTTAITSSLKTTPSNGPTASGSTSAASTGRLPRSPEPVGFDIVRHNVFRYCGIEGLGGTGGPRNMLVEKNLFEWIGWQDAALHVRIGRHQDAPHPQSAIS